MVVPEWFVRWRRATQCWGLALLATSVLLALPVPGPGWVLWFFVAMGADGAGLDPSSTQIWATVVVDVVILETITVALVAAAWVGAGEPVPTGTTAARAWAARWRSVTEAWVPPLTVPLVAIALGAGTWLSLGLLTVCLVVLTAGVCGLAVGARALLARAGTARLAALAVLGAMVVTGIVGALGPGSMGRPVTALVVVSPYTAVADAMTRTSPLTLWSMIGGVANAGRDEGSTVEIPPPGFPLWPASLAVTGTWGAAGVCAAGLATRRRDRKESDREAVHEARLRG